jgi:hypothetical protein
MLTNKENLPHAQSESRLGARYFVGVRARADSEEGEMAGT